MKTRREIPKHIFNIASFGVKIVRYFMKHPEKVLSLSINSPRSLNMVKKLDWIRYYNEIPNSWIDLISKLSGSNIIDSLKESSNQDIYIILDKVITSLNHTQELPKEIDVFIDHNILDLVIKLKVLAGSLLSLIVFREPITVLIDKAKKGDDSSLFKLVQIDKTFLIESWVHHRLKLAELRQDEMFFKKLSDAISKKPFKTRKSHIEAALLIYMFWNECLENYTYPEILYFLKKLGLSGEGYGFNDVDTLRIFIHRLGLKKKAIPKKRT